MNFTIQSAPSIPTELTGQTIEGCNFELKNIKKNMKKLQCYKKIYQNELGITYESIYKLSPMAL